MPVMTDWRILDGAARRARALPLGCRAGSDARMRALLGECAAEIEADALLAPVAAYETLHSEEVGRDHIVLAGGARLDGVPRLAADLATARAVVVAVATIGTRLEQRVSGLFAAREVLRALLFEELGIAALFELSNRLGRRIENTVCTGNDRLSHPYQPGEDGLSLAHQQLLCALAGAGRAGIRLSGAGMMIPLKSVSMIFGVGAKVPRRACVDRCAACQAGERCRYRQRELAA